MTDSDGDDYPSDNDSIVAPSFDPLSTDEDFDGISSEEGDSDRTLDSDDLTIHESEKATEDCDLIEGGGEDMANAEGTHPLYYYFL